jgi:DnaJ-class molecular chaperone
MKTACRYCDGKGFMELRDCSGEIQREETCSFCQGTGLIESEENSESDRPLSELFPLPFNPN